MIPEELKKSMTFRRDGRVNTPLNVFEVNGGYLLGIYQGTLSEFDVLVKYKQKIGEKWSRLRTPKHVHWAVDVLIKLHEDKEKTQEFLDFLLETWDRTVPVKEKSQQQTVLNMDFLLSDCRNQLERYKDLSQKGEYSIKFLVLLAKLLMIQEKSNREDAYMFANLLKELRKGGEIFSVISTASHTRR